MTDCVGLRDLGALLDERRLYGVLGAQDLQGPPRLGGDAPGCYWVGEAIVHRLPVGKLSQMVCVAHARGWNALVGSVNHFGCSHAFTELHVNVKGVDPDDAFSSIPYEKGFNFLFFLESLLGEEKMNAMLKAHCEQYKFSTVNCFKWKKWFLERFKVQHDCKSTLGLLPAEADFVRVCVFVLG